MKALSNSNQQREYIEEQAKERGITNLNVITGDVAKVMVMTYFNGDEVHQEGKGQRERQIYLISIFLNRAKIFAHFRIKEVLDRTQCVRSATLLTVHTLCTKTLLTVHCLINYMFWESCHSCQSCQRSVVFHYLFTLYSLLYCSMLGRRAYVRC